MMESLHQCLLNISQHWIKILLQDDRIDRSITEPTAL